MSKQVRAAPEDVANEIATLKADLEDLQDRQQDLQEQIALANSKLDRRVKALAHELDVPHVGWAYNVEKARFEGPPA